MAHETTEIPDETLAALARRSALLDCEMRVLAPDNTDVDEWQLLKEAEVQNVAFERGDLHVWLETEVRIQEKVARSTRLQPAEFKNHYVPAIIGIVWDMDPENNPTVDIEIEHP